MLDVKMGRTLLCVLVLLLLNSLLYGQDGGGVAILESPTFTLYVGDLASLRCKHHDPKNKMEATFFKDGSPVKMDRVHRSYKEEKMIIYSVSVSDQGSYTCTFGDGKKSEAKELKVRARRRSVTLTAEKTVIPAGGAVTLTCNVYPAAGLKYIWARHLADSPKENIFKTGSRYELDISQGGEYHCQGRSTKTDFYTPKSNAVTVQETGDTSVYETIRGSDDYENDADESKGAAHSSIELKEIGKERK